MLSYLFSYAARLIKVSFHLALHLRREVNHDAVSLIHLVDGVGQDDAGGDDGDDDDDGGGGDDGDDDDDDDDGDDDDGDDGNDDDDDDDQVCSLLTDNHDMGLPPRQCRSKQSATSKVHLILYGTMSHTEDRFNLVEPLNESHDSFGALKG
ncbi:hypothetical protein Tco_1156202 [Tanacetum coccineum]